MTPKAPTLMSRISDIAVKVIAGIILLLATIGFSIIGSKVDKDDFDRHCIENAKKFEQFEQKIKESEQTNKEILNLLRDIHGRVERIDERTKK